MTLPSPLPAATLAAVLVAALMILLSPADAMLNADYYAHTCPSLLDTISQITTSKQIAQPTTAAGALRLFFHDCFTGGCDASVLISSNSFNTAERDADLNLSLPGDAFDVVVRAKAALELSCPGIVSCSDILAIATRNLVSMVGGPFYPLRLGRKDSFTSTARSVTNNLPEANMTVDHMISMFASRGFTVTEMVALTGAHTLGFSHCREFSDRIYGYGGGGPAAFDPALNPRYAAALQKACKNYQNDGTIATFNDVMTPGKFDNLYFQNLGRGLALLQSDQAIAVDPRTAPIVKLYAADQTAFFRDFAKAMQKLSVYGVKTGPKGEVRRTCDKFNSISN